MGTEESTTLTLLGGFLLEDDGATQLLPHSAESVLAFLALRGSLARRTVATTLWPGMSLEHAHANLRTVLWRLGSHSECLLQVTTKTLDLAPHVDVDVRRFMSAAEHRDVDALLSGNALWGDLLPGWYDDWVALEREKFISLRLRTLAECATLLIGQGRFGAALEAALAAVAAEPLLELGHRLVVDVHLAEGNQAEALRHVTRYAQLLHQELGVSPSPEMLARVCSDAAGRVYHWETARIET